MLTIIETAEMSSKIFLTSDFADLLGEMEARESTYFTLTREDGCALALLTTNVELVQRIERTIQDFEDETAAISKGAVHD